MWVEGREGGQGKGDKGCECVEGRGSVCGWVATRWPTTNAAAAATHQQQHLGGKYPTRTGGRGRGKESRQHQAEPFNQSMVRPKARLFAWSHAGWSFLYPSPTATRRRKQARYNERGHTDFTLAPLLTTQGARSSRRTSSQPEEQCASESKCAAHGSFCA